MKRGTISSLCTAAWRILKSVKSLPSGILGIICSSRILPVMVSRDGIHVNEESPSRGLTFAEAPSC